MKKYNKFPFLQSKKALFCTGLFLLSSVNIASAATWQWLPMQNRERLVIQFDNPVDSFYIQRNNGLNISIQLPASASDTEINQTGSLPQGDFVHNFRKNGNTLELSMNKSDFGYIYTQPDSNTLVLDIYQDSLASRFYPYEERSTTTPTQPQAPIQNQQPAQTQTVTPPTPQTPPISSPTAPVVQTPTQEVDTPPLVQNTNQNQIPTQQITSPPVPQVSTQAPQVEENSLQDVIDHVEKVDIPALNNQATQSFRDSIEAAQSGTVPTTPPPAPIQPAQQSPFPTNNLEEINEAAEKIYYGNSFIADFKDTPANTVDSVAVPTQVYKGNEPQDYETFEFMEEVDSIAPIQAIETGISPENASLFERPENETPQPIEVAQETQVSTQEEIAQVETPIETPIEQPLETEIPLEQPLEPAVAEATDGVIAPALLDEMVQVDPANGETVTQVALASDTEPTTIEEAKALNRTIVYHDAEGNEVPAPPDVKALMFQADDLLKDRNYEAALPILEQLKDLRLDKDPTLNQDLKEDLLYEIVKVKAELYKDSLQENGQEVLNAALEAMNYNPSSERVPNAITTLAYTHLLMGNQEDAKGYIMFLKQQYPYELTVPNLLFRLGRDYLQEGQYALAADTFDQIVTEYPDSLLAENSAIAQAFAYYKQGLYEKALPLIEFVNLRWPSAYLDNLDFLPMSADVQISQGKLRDALETLWTQYNINPKSEETPEILNKIALLYYALNNKDAATKVQLEILNIFPDSPYAPKSLLRMAENTFTPVNPNLDLLLNLYEQPNPRIPSINYQIILDDYPETPEAVDALTRLGAFSFYNKDYLSALNYAEEVMKKYPDRLQFNVAGDILLRAFAHNLANALEEENYNRALALWEKYPYVHDYYLPLEDDLRIALARAYLNRGDQSKGLELLEPFIETEQDPKYGLYAYNIFLAHYLSQGNWDAILAMDEKVNSWTMPLDVRDQHDYTTALSAQNLGLNSRAMPLWTNLAQNTEIPLYQRAYATYFLARDAEEKQDLRASYQYNLDALAMFEELLENRSEFADPQRIRESIAALMDVTEVAGRFAESLEWLNKYAEFVPQDSPDYGGMQLREARIYRKMNDMNTWQSILEDIVRREPDTVFGKMASSELTTEKLARDIKSLTP